MCQTAGGPVDQEVAVLYTGELANCLWAEKAGSTEGHGGGGKGAKWMM